MQRLNGELLLRMERWAEAEAALQSALSAAREQSARLLELRAATSLARLWRSRGQNDQARDLLGPLYLWFTEGLETADLREAKSLLEAMDPTTI
jgi:predicted ATPase